MCFLLRLAEKHIPARHRKWSSRRFEAKLTSNIRGCTFGVPLAEIPVALSGVIIPTNCQYLLHRNVGLFSCGRALTPLQDPLGGPSTRAFPAARLSNDFSYSRLLRWKPMTSFARNLRLNRSPLSISSTTPRILLLPSDGSTRRGKSNWKECVRGSTKNFDPVAKLL